MFNLTNWLFSSPFIADYVNAPVRWRTGRGRLGTGNEQDVFRHQEVLT